MKTNTILKQTSQILYGGDYNPEQWPESVWKEDMRLMHLAGVNFVSIGIFSWAKLQPTEKTYDFGWLDRLMDLLAENGIWADLATSTASPPPWMSRYPDLSAIDIDGNAWSHGSRQHFSPSSPTYLKFAEALVKKLAARYAKHPALAAWHLNNEYACHMQMCYGEASAKAFLVWLKQRYGSLDALNATWGTAFWSQQYSAWEDVLPPRKTPMFSNPAQTLDFHRFTNAAFLKIAKMECSILRKATPGLPITTNMMGFFKPLDYFEWAKELDFVSLDSYPDPLDYGALIGARAYDLIRSLKPGRPFVLMEQVTSHVNWRTVNVAKPIGTMRLWSLQSIARGADGVMFFQWRQAASGAEKFHGSMVPHAPNPQKTRVFQEVRDLGAELKKLESVTGTLVRSRAAIVVDWETWWALELPSKPTEFNYAASIDPIHRYFYERNIAVDFVTPTSDLSGFALVVAPTLYLLRKNDAKHLDRYVRAGGTLFATCFSGIVDENERIVSGGYPGYLRETLGLWVEEWWPLGPNEARKVQLGGGALTGRQWSEVIHLNGAKAMATFDEGHLKGRPAVTRNARGKGEAFYVGTVLDDSSLGSLFDGICRDLKLTAPVKAPKGIEVSLREGGGKKFLFLLNHNAKSVRLSDGGLTGRDLITGRKNGKTLVLKANDVAVIALK